MVKADDAAKISRVVERFKFATVDKAKIESEIVKTKAEKSTGKGPDAPDRNDTEKLVNDLLPSDEGKSTPESEKAVQKEAPVPANPEAAKNDFFQEADAKSRPSALTSENKSKSDRGTSNKPSVKEELREIKAARARKKRTRRSSPSGRLTISRKPMPLPLTSSHRMPTNPNLKKQRRGKHEQF
jgi:hypothetical protein